MADMWLSLQLQILRLRTVSNPIITFTSIAICSSYEVTPTYRTGLNPVTFGYSTYSYVSIGDLFCIKSGSSTLRVLIDKDSSESKDISWLSFNITTNKLEGTCRTPGTTYNLIIRAKPNLYFIDYQLTLKINSCADAFCELCHTSTTCDQCKSGYSMEENNTKCIAEIGAFNARTAGLIFCLMALITGVLASVIFSCCISKSISLGLYTIIEYYQLILALTLLHTVFPDVVQYFIKDLKFFKLDLSELAIWTKVYDSVKIQYVGSEQMNSKLGDLGFDYSSTVVCFFGLEATIILALIAHLLFFLFSLIIDVYNDIQEYFKKIKNNQEYKPKCMMLFLIKTWRFFNRGFYISSFFESFLFLTICCLSEIANFSEESLFSWLSLLCACLIILFEIGFCTYCFYNILKAVSLDDYYGPNESFFKGLKYRKSSARKYHIAFILRRTVIAFAAVFIHSRYLQFALYSVANFLHLGYILFELPFENIIDNMVYCIADASICAIGLIYCLFISNGDSINYTQQDMSNYGVIH